MGSDPRPNASQTPSSSFNSRSRMGSDSRPPWNRSRQPKFQFTLPHGERPAPAPTAPAGEEFQFTLPHGERRRGGVVILYIYRFNSRSRMGSDAAGCPSASSTTSFNSRSRMGSDIHKAKVRPRPETFQFTLPHGERLSGRPFGASPPEFQFTLPHGERQVLRGQTAAALRVSIHAPAWGATCIRPSATPPTSFQFTLPHGERHVGGGCDTIYICFNSRSRMGSDLHQAFCDAADVVSIHAPAWGATCIRPSATPPMSFQFTLPHGERRVARLAPPEGSQVSIHAPAWGATCPQSSPLEQLAVSIHAPAWGATQGLRPGRVGPASFNSRSRMGSDRTARRELG